MNRAEGRVDMISETERIASALETREKGGLVASLYVRVPLQRELNLLLNRYSDDSEEKERGDLEGEIRSKQRQLSEANGDGHPNPEWLLPTMAGNIEYTFGNYENSLTFHEKALECANESYQVAISCANLSDTSRRIGDASAAVIYAMRAVEIDSGNDGFWAYLTMALYAAGQVDEARVILSNIASGSSLGMSQDVWRNYLLYYPEFLEMKKDGVPEVTRLLDMIEKGG